MCGRSVDIFLDRSWPIRGVAIDIYAPLIPIRRTVTTKTVKTAVNIIVDLFYPPSIDN